VIWEQNKIDMNVIYKKWLDFKVNHNYFTDGLCEVIKLTPFKESGLVMKNYNILSKNNLGVFSLYIGVADQEPETLKEALANVPDLYFSMLSSDQIFHNYTQIPFQIDTATLFFENEKDQTTSALQEAAFVGKEDIVPVKPKFFDARIPEDTTKVKVIDAAGATVLELGKTSFSNGQCPVNLQGVPPGILELWVNDRMEEKFLLLDSPENWVVGVLRLSAANITDKTKATSYQIDFASREIYWQYKILSTSTKTKIKKMTVTGETGNFKGPETEELANGHKASVFVSETPLKLDEMIQVNPLLTLEYSGNFSSDINSMELKLPNPYPGNLELINNQQSEKRLLVSTIVYV
jgi:hypothetical protein